MKKSIEQFIEEIPNHTFSKEGEFEMWLRERIPALVEEIYKEELAVVDNRFKDNEEYWRKFEELAESREIEYAISLDKQKEAFTKEINKTLLKLQGGGNGRRLLTQLKEKI